MRSSQTPMNMPRTVVKRKVVQGGISQSIGLTSARPVANAAPASVAGKRKKSSIPELLQSAVAAAETAVDLLSSPEKPPAKKSRLIVRKRAPPSTTTQPLEAPQSRQIRSITENPYSDDESQELDMFATKFEGAGKLKYNLGTSRSSKRELESATLTDRQPLISSCSHGG